MTSTLSVLGVNLRREGLLASKPGSLAPCARRPLDGGWMGAQRLSKRHVRGSGSRCLRVILRQHRTHCGGDRCRAPTGGLVGNRRQRARGDRPSHRGSAHSRLRPEPPQHSTRGCRPRWTRLLRARRHARVAGATGSFGSGSGRSVRHEGEQGAPSACIGFAIGRAHAPGQGLPPNHEVTRICCLRHRWSLGISSDGD